MESFAILLAWAITLSGYQMDLPEIRFVPPKFFADNVCGGKECDVRGAFLDGEAPDTIYIDERYKNDDSLFAASIIVHEFSHRGQYQSGKFDSDNCEHQAIRERESYRIQNDFLVANGHAPVIRMVQPRCNHE